MLTAEIKKYVRESGKVSLEELSVYFNTELETVRNALNTIMEDENPHISKKKSCGKCKNCQCHTRKQYRWVN